MKIEKIKKIIARILIFVLMVNMQSGFMLQHIYADALENQVSLVDEEKIAKYREETDIVEKKEEGTDDSDLDKDVQEEKENINDDVNVEEKKEEDGEEIDSNEEELEEGLGNSNGVNKEKKIEEDKEEGKINSEGIDEPEGNEIEEDEEEREIRPEDIEEPEEDIIVEKDNVEEEDEEGLINEEENINDDLDIEEKIEEDEEEIEKKENGQEDKKEEENVEKIENEEELINEEKNNENLVLENEKNVEEEKENIIDENVKEKSVDIEEEKVSTKSEVENINGEEEAKEEIEIAIESNIDVSIEEKEEEKDEVATESSIDENEINNVDVIQKNDIEVSTKSFALPKINLGTKSFIGLKLLGAGDPNQAYWYVTDEDGNSGEASLDKFNIIHFTIDPQSVVDYQSGAYTFGTEFDSNVREKIKTVVFESAFQPSITANLFKNFRNLTEIKNLSKLDTSKVTDMDCMFGYCYNLVNLDLSNFNTSEVTNMTYMFYDCQSIVNLDLSNFNTSKVTNMKYMFGYCTNLVNLDLSNFDTSKVMDMTFMFYGCQSIVNLDISSFKIEKFGVDIRRMFCKLSNVEKIYATENFDIDNVYPTEFDGFSNSPNLTGGNGTKGAGTYITLAKIDKVGQKGYFTDKSITHKFIKETKINDKVGTTKGWFTITRVEDKLEVDRGVVGQNETITVYQVEGFTTKEIKVIATASRINESLVVDHYMTDRSRATWKIPETGMVEGDNILIQVTFERHPNTAFWYVTDEAGNRGKASLDKFNVLHFTTDEQETVEEQSGMYLFQNAFKSIVGEKIKTVIFETEFQPYYTRFMFYYFKNLIEIKNLSKLDTSKVTEMQQMFNNCSNLVNLDLSSFDTTKATNMKSMFAGCSNLVNLDLSKFETGTSDVDISEMFNGASNLEVIYITDAFVYDKLIGTDVFKDCSKLIGGNGTKWSSSNEGLDYAKIDNVGQKGYFTKKEITHKIIKETKINDKVDTIKGLFTITRGTEDLEVDRGVVGQEEKITITPVSDVYTTKKVKVIATVSSIEDELTITIDPSTNKSIATWTIPTTMVEGDDILIQVTFEENPDKAYWYVTNNVGTEGPASDTFNVLHFTTEKKDIKPNQSGTYTFGTEFDAGVRNYIKTVNFEKEFQTTKTANLFNNFGKLIEIKNLVKLNTSDVIDMQNMFNGCSSLVGLDLSLFDTTKVINMKNMFSGCTSFTKLNLKSFKTGTSDVDITGMFNGATNLEIIYTTEDFVNGKLTGSNVFSSCSKLIGGNGTKWESAKIGAEYAKIDNVTQTGYFTDELTSHKIEVDGGISDKIKVYKGTTDTEIKRAITGQQVTLEYDGTIDIGSLMIYDTDEVDKPFNDYVVDKTNKKVTFTMPERTKIGDITINIGFAITKQVNGKDKDSSGTFDISREKSPAGIKIIVSNIKPTNGNEFKSIKVRFTNSPYTDVYCEKIGNNYSFEMPNKSVTVDITFGPKKVNPTPIPRPTPSGGGGGGGGGGEVIYERNIKNTNETPYEINLQINNNWRFDVINGKRYYTYDGVTYVKGWVFINNHWYYFDDKDYSMFTGYHLIGGEIYYFSENKEETDLYGYGMLITNAITPLGYIANQNGELIEFKDYLKSINHKKASELS